MSSAPEIPPSAPRPSSAPPAAGALARRSPGSAPDSPPPYATIVLDCDSTLSAIEGVEELAGARRDEIRALTDQAMGGTAPLDAVFGLRLAKIRPEKAAVAALGARYVATLQPDVEHVVEALRDLGKRVCIVSGGLFEPVLHLGRHLGLAREDVYAVQVFHDEDGVYTGFDEFSPLVRAGGKAEVVARLAEAGGPVCVVGDGATDLEAAVAAARFVAYGGVVRREAVFAAARVGTSVPDFAALLPLVCSEAELARLERHPRHAALVEKALALYGGTLPATPPPVLWIPGPTEVRPELRAECARPSIGHRTRAMAELLERCDPHLAWAFGLASGSTARVAVHTTSATGLMEASLNGVEGRVLAVVNGAFSARYAKIARSLGKDTVELAVPWGRAVAADHLARTLAEEGPFAAVTVVSNETSTGVRTRLEDVARVLRAHPDVLLLVDLVSYIAGAPVDLDANGLDFAFAGVQKALALPPGISVMACSERYLDRARTASRRGFYLDPVSIVEGHAQRKPAATPCIPLHYALARQLEDITAGVTLPARDRGRTGRAAWEARFAKHERMQAATVAWARRRGLELLPPPAEASPTVSCIQAGPIDVARLAADLLERGLAISNGYGELKGKTFRIGHMGDHTEEGLAELLTVMDDVLDGQGVKVTE